MNALAVILAVIIGLILLSVIILLSFMCLDLLSLICFISVFIFRLITKIKSKNTSDNANNKFKPSKESIYTIVFVKYVINIIYHFYHWVHSVTGREPRRANGKSKRHSTLNNATEQKSKGTDASNLKESKPLGMAFHAKSITQGKR
jgi:prepilin signal peptidase PulO-like enzyme (type II secretory pathway)